MTQCNIAGKSPWGWGPIMISASAVILAGGQSQRMGREKAALPFGRTTILQRLIAELRREFNDLIVAAAPKAHETSTIEDLLPAEPSVVTLLRDEAAYLGAADALARGLRAARNEVVFVCSCDLPLMRADVARALCEMIGHYEAVIPEIGGRLQPLYAAYRRQCASAISAGIAGGERRLTALVTQLNLLRVGETELRSLDSDLTSFLNVNTPEDYSRALKLAGIANSSS
jgi:molybdenum cofactor guanylyltransferase